MPVVCGIIRYLDRGGSRNNLGEDNQIIANNVNMNMNILYNHTGVCECSIIFCECSIIEF